MRNRIFTIFSYQQYLIFQFSYSMIRDYLLTTLFLCFSMANYGQVKVSGTVVDATDKTKLAQATVMLLQAKDSILIDFTRTSESGVFSLIRPDTARHLLIVSYPKYGDFYEELVGTTAKDFGQIGLTNVSNLLEEVMVTGKIPIVIKGDTTEYDASSFTVEKNAKVEDLLKVLPGISVDASGKITAQGKTVEKVLLDGEEFFGDDPTLVTRNIRSDMVDKVQLYEKKSDEAERTGVDDGTRIQTINVKLKEDAKKGMFGKAEGAVGNDDYYFGKLAFNKFNGSQKIGAFLLKSNDGNINLDWGEEEKFGMSGMSAEMTDDGNMYYSGNWDEFSQWDGRGFPTAFNSGISFSDSWKESKHKLNFSYKYGQMANNVIAETIAQNNLSDTVQLNSSTSSNRDSDLRKHRFNSRYDWKLDSLTTLTLKLAGSKGKLEVDDYTQASSKDINLLDLNNNDRRESTSSTSGNFTYDAYLTRKLKKAGRSISLRFAGNTDQNDGDTYLNSKTNFYRAGIVDSIYTIDQYKDVSSKSNNIRTSITYTEPISKKLNSTLGYDYNNSKQQSVTNSFNKDGNGDYSIYDSEFSNDFDFNTQRHAINLGIAFKSEKFEWGLTNNFRNDNMFQRNNNENIAVKRDFTTYNPNARIRYNFSKSKSLGMYYSHGNNLPSLSQIQPLRQNTDPLNIIVGNESLTPAKTDNLNLYYYSYNMLRGVNVNANLSFNQQRNSIQQNVLIDELGLRTIMYENLTGYVANSANMWLGGGFDLLKKIKLRANFGGDGSYSNYYNYINGELNENTNYSYAIRLSLHKNSTKNVDFNLSVAPGWRKMNSSLSPERNSSGFINSGYLDYKWHLPFKLSLYGDLSYSYEAPTKAFDEKFEQVIFKPGISRKFLKGENLLVDFYVNDVFQQNKGFRRYQSGNMITQNTYNTISRYFMLKVSWDFTSMKGGTE